MTHQHDALDNIHPRSDRAARQGAAGKVMKLAFLSLIVGLFAVIMIAWAAFLAWAFANLGSYVLSVFR